jgi:hypothetical protein
MNYKFITNYNNYQVIALLLGNKAILLYLRIETENINMQKVTKYLAFTTITY